MGPPECRQVLVALHGGPGLSHESLRPLDALAGPDRCVVYFDQRGIGRSSAPSGSWTSDDLVADVEAVRAHWGARRIDLLGHSWGAYLAARYTGTHRRRVRRLVLSSPAPLTLTGWSDFEAEMRARIRRFEASGEIPPKDPDANRGDACEQNTERVLAAYLYDPSFRPEGESRLDCSRHTFSRTWAALPKPELVPTAVASRKRALLVQGEGEATRDAIREEWLQFHGGRLHTVTIPRCGHVLHTECPDAWTEVVEAAL